MNYTELSADLVKKCLANGADAAEVYLVVDRELSIQVQDGELETIQEASSQGVGFRVFVKGRMGFSHCNDLSAGSLVSTLKQAISFARLTTPDEHNVLAADPATSQVEGLYDPAIADVAMEKKIDMAMELEELAMQDNRVTRSSGSGYGEGETEIYLANSNGLQKHYRSSACFLGVSVVAEKGEQKNTGGEYCSRRFFSDLKSPEEIAAEASRKAWELLDPQMVKTQRAAVIFHPDVGRSLLGGVISALNGERVLQGASFLKDSLERSFASSLLTIIDDGTYPKGMASKPFDGEGTPTARRVLVERGMLKSFLYNCSVAHRAGTESTGNASRRGFTSLPGIGVHNLFVEPGSYSPEEMIAATPRGLLLKGVTGYGIDPVSGNFSGGATGFWIENGQIVFPVKGLTIAGTAHDILNAIDMSGNDADLMQSFACPSLRVREMQIGGK